jgi:iron complex outermembrane receptor protein
MKLTYKALIKSTVAIPLFMAAMPAFAADADQGASEPPAGDIIVSARRVEERLQDVPISISVVDQNRLTTANIVSSEDLAKVVPGLNVQSRYSSESTNFSIRGFSQELRTSASVGTYFADVVAPRGGGVSLQGGDGAGPGYLFDLQNVQVLKGPQGTLFGRNTTGGAVLLVPKKPTFKTEGYLEGTYGSYNMFRIQGVLNVPLASWARIRLGLDRQTRDGYINNVSTIGPKAFGNVNYTSFRGSLVLDVSSQIENYSVVSYSNSNNYGSPPQIYKANPDVLNPKNFYGIVLAPQIARLNASGDPYQIEQKLANPQSLSRQFQIINTTKWLASDNLTVKNIFSYSQIKQPLRQDIFASSLPLADLALRLPAASYAGLAFAVPADARVQTSLSFSPDSGWTNNQKNVTDELQIQGRSAGGALNYQMGLYYEHSFAGAPTVSISPLVGSLCSPNAFTEISNIQCSQAGVTATGKSGYNYSSGTLEFINMAAYGQATYAVTDQFKLTGGLRYTYDRTRGTSTGLLYGFAGNFPGGYGSAVLTGCQPNYAAFAGCTTPASLLRTSTKKPTWTLNATYSPTHDMMVYASYSRGYRQGSAAPFAVGGNTTFQPESVDSYEVGVKSSFHGAVSGYMNLAGFYSSLKNQQLQLGLLDSTSGRTATSIFNVGKSRIYGMDADGMVRFADYFRVTGSATYVNSKVTELNPSILTSFSSVYDVVQPSAGLGDALPYTPKWSVNVSPTFTLPMDKANGTIDLSATLRYSSSYSTEASKGSDMRASAVKQLDLSANWTDVLGTPIDLSVFATNVTKQVTYTLNQTLFTSFGFNQRYLGQPRIIGARLRVRFGG